MKLQFTRDIAVVLHYRDITEELGDEASHWSLNLLVDAVIKEGIVDTISVYEMTGIQALKHKYPDKPVIPGKAAHMEFEYTAMGRPA